MCAANQSGTDLPLSCVAIRPGTNLLCAAKPSGLARGHVTGVGGWSDGAPHQRDLRPPEKIPESSWHGHGISGFCTIQKEIWKLAQEICASGRRPWSKTARAGWLVKEGSWSKGWLVKSLGGAQAGQIG
eukprot:847425-Rhodomonas_salina.4